MRGIHLFSIVQKKKRCWVCGVDHGLEIHHIFGGVANRRISEKYGLKVWLCAEHHRGDNGAQYNHELNRELKRQAQAAFETIYGHDKWMALIMKNYL